MSSPRVLVVLNTSTAWSRGILRGFTAIARERGWEILHYHPSADLDWLASEWTPDAAVVGPELRSVAAARLPARPVVSVNADRSEERIASVCLSEEAIAEAALQHLLAKGFRNVASFRFDDSPFAAVRERAFLAGAVAAGAQPARSWWDDAAEPARSQEVSAALQAWLRDLPKPCGVFTCSDAWGRVVARYAKAAGLRVPEDVALVGVDNDVIECELISPPLSSVAVPWMHMGEMAASLVQLALEGRAISGRRLVFSPLDVVVRRSSDTFAIDDSLVAEAVAWIHAHADRRLTVPMVAGAVAAGRQRLERRFRAALDRTVQQEIRRAHVETAKRLLARTPSPLPEIAKLSGFTNAALMSEAFRRELGVPPGTYRRRMLEDAAGNDP